MSEARRVKFCNELAKYLIRMLAGWQGQELISRAESFARDATHDWPKQEILIDNHRKSFFNKDSM